MHRYHVEDDAFLFQALYVNHPPQLREHDCLNIFGPERFIKVLVSAIVHALAFDFKHVDPKLHLLGLELKLLLVHLQRDVVVVGFH